MPPTRKNELAFDVEVSGDLEIEAKLRAIAERAGHTGPAFAAMLGDLEDAERNWFDTSGNYRWERLEDNTKRRHGEHPILELSGALMRSLVERHATYAVRESSDGELRFGTFDPAAHLVAKRRPVLAPLARQRPRLIERLRHHILGLET